MKTKELIAELQKLDPGGETEVCIDNADIYTVEWMDAYWDGCLQVLITDPKLEGFNVIGVKVTTRGHKIKLKTLDIEDVFFDNPDAILDVSELDERRAEEVRRRVLPHRSAGP